MRKKNVGIFLIFASIFAIFSSFQPAMAQYGGSRNSWFPRNNPSALSPWLEMQRVSTSELDTYNQFVKPRLDMERYIMAQHREMNLQSDHQKAIQNTVTQMQSQNYQFTGEATATGKGATYRNYLHFYPQKK